MQSLRIPPSAACFISKLPFPLCPFWYFSLLFHLVLNNKEKTKKVKSSSSTVDYFYILNNLFTFLRSQSLSLPPFIIALVNTLCSFPLLLGPSFSPSEVYRLQFFEATASHLRNYLKNEYKSIHTTMFPS